MRYPLLDIVLYWPSMSTLKKRRGGGEGKRRGGEERGGEGRGGEREGRRREGGEGCECNVRGEGSGVRNLLTDNTV